MKKDRKRRRSRSRSKERKRGDGGTEEKLQKMQNQLNNLTNVLTQLVKSQQEMANTNTDLAGKKVLIPYEFCTPNKGIQKKRCLFHTSNALLIKEYRQWIGRFCRSVPYEHCE